MSNKPISLAPVPDPGAIRAACDRAEARRTLERTQLLSLWKREWDTKDIADRLSRPESWVYNTLSKLRELTKSEASPNA